jgi:hypothetical protein
VKKVIVSLVLGLGLLSGSRSAFAEQTRAPEPRWQLELQSGAISSPLDLGLWLSRRLTEGLAVPVPPVPMPPPNQGPIRGTNPISPNEVCNPERSHCPTG